MALHRRAARRDANEAEIVEALRAAGAKVWPISGPGIPDLLVAYQGRFLLLEVKTRAGKPTRAQIQFASEVEDCPVFIVRTPAEALKAMEICHG
jgi:Holliday junction resolvase